MERSVGTSATVSQTLLAKVRALPGVESAAGGIEDEAKIIGKNGKTISTRGPPSFGYGIDFSQQRFNPLELVSGSWPNAGEVAIDKSTAKKQDFRLGQLIGVEARGPVRKYRLTGTVALGSASTGGTTIAAFDLSTAQRVLQKRKSRARRRRSRDSIPRRSRRSIASSGEHGTDAVLRQLGRNGAIVTDAFADDKELRLVSRIRTVTPTAM